MTSSQNYFSLASNEKLGCWKFLFISENGGICFWINVCKTLVFLSEKQIIIKLIISCIYIQNKTAQYYRGNIHVYGDIIRIQN